MAGRGNREGALLMNTLLTLTVTAILLAVSGIAQARDVPERTLAPITVQHSNQRDCTPPSADAGCAPLHVQIRHTFSKREIGMLFGARTAFLEYPDSYSRVYERYMAFQRDVELYGVQRVALVIR
jgi:hypothetical protein